MMTYEYNPMNSIIHLKAPGILVANAPINYFKEIDQDPKFKPKIEERIYSTNLEDIAFTYNDIVSIKLRLNVITTKKKFPMEYLL